MRVGREKENVFEGDVFCLDSNSKVNMFGVIKCDLASLGGCDPTSGSC